MFDHVSIGVADIARSKKFYDAALRPLGFALLSDSESSLGYGEKAVQLWLGATKTPAATDIEALNDLLAASPARTTLRRERNGFSWDVDMRGSTALGQLAPVLWSAGDLLTGGKLDKVRRCANPECGWLFFDDSRAGKRRWCSMQACGNRAKARRHYHKSRAE